MAFFRGEEGSVSFDNGTGTVGAIASTTAWTLDTTGTKKLSFNGIITGTSFSSTVGDISTVSVSFVTTGDITSAI